MREFPLKSGPADYLLYADCRAVGVVEAKPEGHTLTGVETQSGKYLEMGITEQVVYMRGDNPDRSAARLAEMLPELRRLQPVASS